MKKIFFGYAFLFPLKKMCWRQCLLTIIFAIITHLLFAQFSLTGKITDSTNKPLAGCNILLHKTADTSLIKGAVSNTDGSFRLRNVGPGNYLISISFTGFKTNWFPVNISGSNILQETDAVVLSPDAFILKEAKVAAKKPLLEQKIDRLIINVENSITSAGSTALEFLERTPGVIIDHQNNLLSINGKDGVVLMINNKISRIPVAAAVQMLAGMSSGNIEKIELITTPPANLDAAGNAGYINIILKENNNFGTNGSYSLTAGYGKGFMSAASLNINHRKGKINIYGDISYSRIKKPLELNGFTRVSNDGDIFEKYNSTDRTDTTILLNGRLGLDYQLNKRTIIGILLAGNERYYTQSEQKQSLLLKNQNTNTLTTFSNSELNDWKNYSINLNSLHSFKENQNLSVNLDYVHYKNDQPVNYFSTYYDGSGDFIFNRTSRSGKITYIDFYVGGLEYTGRIGKKITMEAGIKETISGFKNDIGFESFNQNNWVKDAALSAEYKLNENYSAAYTSFNISLDHNTEIKFGMRYEYTNSNLGTATTKNIVDRHYGNFFPTIFLSHKLNENNKINFSYNARINRPAFTDLAPFTYYIDAYTLLTGNPALQASVTNTIKGDYAFKTYLFSISYSKEDKAITGFQPDLDSVTLKTIITPQNLINKKTVSGIISLPLSVTKWWTMQYNITGIWQQVNALYKKVAVQLSQAYINIYSSQRFTLPQKFSLELSGFYQSASLSGITKVKRFGTFDVGLKKKLSQKSSIQFAASNILNTLQRRSTTNLPEQNLVGNGRAQFSQPTFKFTFSHNFGKEKLKGNRNRLTGAEEEKGRVVR